MKACPVAVMMIGLLPALARAQSGTDVSAAIPVHPDVPTILELPDAITRVWSIDRGELRVQGVGNQVYVRPRPDTPAGVEALVEVETATMHRIFLVRVVARAADAKREVIVPAAAAASCEPDTSRARGSVAPAAAAPAASTPPSPAPAPSAPARPAGPEPAETEPTKNESTGAPDDERTALVTMPPRFHLSAHAVAGLGFIGLNIAGYRPETALRSLHTLGLRLVGARQDTWWSLQADLSGEWPHGAMLYVPRRPASKSEVSGPRLRLELGMRVGFGDRWSPSAYAGIGVQMHLRRIEEIDGEIESVETLERAAVLTLGVGLQYRARRRILLGLDLLIREGGPDDYRSMVALLTMGRSLDQGD